MRTRRRIMAHASAVSRKFMPIVYKRANFNKKNYRKFHPSGLNIQGEPNGKILRRKNECNIFIAQQYVCNTNTMVKFVALSGDGQSYDG